MIVRCPKCQGQHLDFEDLDPHIRKYLNCGVYFVADDDEWQVGDEGPGELVERPLRTPAAVEGV